MALPVPYNDIRIQGPHESWPGVYPQSFVTIGGTYGSTTQLEVVTADGVLNGRPIYKSANGGWSIYYRSAGYWARDFNDVSDEWDGTVGIQDNLFASTV